MITTYFKNLLADRVFGGKASVVLPDKLYVGFSKTAPQPDGTNVTEPAAGSATGYTRVLIPQLSEAVDGAVTNEAMVSAPESVTAWGTLTHWCVFDAAEAGHLLLAGELANPKTVSAQSALSFRPGELTLYFDEPA